jgi:putative MATE family efflux protein
MKPGAKIGRDFTSGPIFGPLVSFSIPFMLSNALQVLYNTVDMAIVGRYMGEIGLTAVSNASKVIIFLSVIGLGLSTSAQIYVAQLIGQGRRKDLNTAIGTLFTFLLAIGAAMTLAGFVFARPLLAFLKVPAAAYGGSLAYLRVCSAGIIFAYGYNMTSAVLRGMGDSKRPFLFIAIASVANVVLDLLFVAVFRWGEAGAALATAMGHAISFLFSWAYLYRRREAFGFDFRLASFRVDNAVIRAFLRLGIPLAIRFSVINLTMMYVIRWINVWGHENGLQDIASAVFNVGVQMDDLVTKVTLGIMQATTGIVGQNYGARKFDRVRKAVTSAWLFTIGFYVVYTCFLLFRTEGMFRLFNVTDPDALKLAHVFAWSIVWQFPGLALTRGTNGFVNGIGNANLSLVLGLLDGVVLRIGFSWLLGDYLNMGFGGYVLGYGIACYGLCVPAIIYLFFFPWEKRKAVTA